jgi:hypothetical protein
VGTLDPVSIQIRFQKSRSPFDRDKIVLFHNEPGAIRDLTVIVPGQGLAGQALLGSPLLELPPNVDVPLNFALAVRKGATIPLRISGQTADGELFIFNSSIETR